MDVIQLLYHLNKSPVKLVLVRVCTVSSETKSATGLRRVRKQWRSKVVPERADTSISDAVSLQHLSLNVLQTRADRDRSRHHSVDYMTLLKAVVLI
jgi:hypothetical protein